MKLGPGQSLSTSCHILIFDKVPKFKTGVNPVITFFSFLVLYFIQGFGSFNGAF